MFSLRHRSLSLFLYTPTVTSSLSTDDLPPVLDSLYSLGRDLRPLPFPKKGRRRSSCRDDGGTKIGSYWVKPEDRRY